MQHSTMIRVHSLLEQLACADKLHILTNTRIYKAVEHTEFFPLIWCVTVHVFLQ
uniref:Uncharacterized protein n=1 Tax=Arundo donax TaxID=35708 RepID=A0A0A9AVL7_ARUDO